jgi:type IX secretion system PorP/SprF family membrane protein
MRKAVFTFILLLFSCFAQGQQDVQFSQYMLNSYGINPAAGGFSDSWEVLAGRRTQWTGFENAPVTNFLGIHKAIAKKYYRKYWHGAGLYVYDDDAGMVGQRALYLSYAYHQRVAGRYTLSFGIFGGARMHSISSTLYDPNDPALNVNPAIVTIPEFVPGLRFRSKTSYVDLSVRNLYKTKLEGQGKTIGTPGELKPHFYLSAATRVISHSYYYSFVPSVMLRYTQGAWPSVDGTFMMYIKRRVGLGVSYRANDAAVAILQVRITKNIIAGFSYDYVTSRMRNGASSSKEMIFGFSPIAVTDYEPTRSVSECPVMEF